MTTTPKTIANEQPPQPEWTPNGVPNCSESCRHHDGKRCGLMGLRAPAICEPTVEGMAAERITLRSEVERLHAENARFVKVLAMNWNRATRQAVVTEAALLAVGIDAALQPQPEDPKP